MPGWPSKPRLPRIGAEAAPRWLGPAAPAEARDEGSGLEDATGVGLEPRR